MYTPIPVATTTTETPAAPCVDCGSTRGAVRPERAHQRVRRIGGRCWTCHLRKGRDPGHSAAVPPCVVCGTLGGAVRRDRQPLRPFRSRGHCKACYQRIVRSSAPVEHPAERYADTLLEGMDGPGPEPHDPTIAEIAARCARIQRRRRKMALPEPERLRRVYRTPWIVGGLP